MNGGRFALVSLAVTAFGLAGCFHAPGGNMLSTPDSSITYESTEHLQKTVMIVDTRTEETVFTMDIPVGKQLTIQFARDRGNDPVNTPDLMYYQVWDIGTRLGQLRNSVTVPNAASRRIDVRVNQEPAYADAPADMPLRVDQNQPDWWTSKGGPLPDSQNGRKIYDN